MKRMILALVLLAATVAPASAQCGARAHRFPILWAVSHPFQAIAEMRSSSATAGIVSAQPTAQAPCATCGTASLAVDDAPIFVSTARSGPVFVSAPPVAAPRYVVECNGRTCRVVEVK